MKIGLKPKKFKLNSLLFDETISGPRTDGMKFYKDLDGESSGHFFAYLDST
jgi:hypothetical protein